MTKFKRLILFVFTLFAFTANASVLVANADTIADSVVVLDTDSLLEHYLSNLESTELKSNLLANNESNKTIHNNDSLLAKSNDNREKNSVNSTELLKDTTAAIKADDLLERFFSKERISSLKDSLLSDIIPINKLADNKETSFTVSKKQLVADSTITEKQIVAKDSIIKFTIPEFVEIIPHDTLHLKTNPFFIDIVFRELPLLENLEPKFDFGVFYFNSTKFKYLHGYVNTISSKSAAQLIDDLRQNTYKNISKSKLCLFAVRHDQLPDPNGIKNHIIDGRNLSKVKFVNGDLIGKSNNKLIVKKETLGPWYYKANALAQFSQNYVSPNWYKGGNSNVAVLGILQGSMNYDNKKSIQWENSGEWRMGFNSVEGETIRMFSTNDDVIKFNSKLGVKAGGKWFYSGSVDVSTQFFNSYKGINSTDLKASFLAPLRLNIGVGFDYKYKKYLSLMISPLSYKYIYVNEKTKISHNLFGVKDDENHLSEIGSSFKAVVSLPITHEIQLESKLSFYTNYEKVELDWELVCNMTINRFMSTRISFNPRYDNTVIETAGNKAEWQFRELLSVGFSHKF